MEKNRILPILIALLVGIALGWGAAQLFGAPSQGGQAVQAASSASSQEAQSSGTSGGGSSEGAASGASAAASTADAGASEAGQSQRTSAEDPSAESSAGKDAQDLSAEAEQDYAGSYDDGSFGASSSSDAYAEDEYLAYEGGAEPSVDEDGTYTSKEEVAAYIHAFGHLPSNYISKSKAKKAGWVSSEGNLDDVLPGMSIGGSEFYNNEGLLPDAPGRTWTECDINYRGGYRGAERIVFSSDGLIFYTDDHYESFEQLY